MVLRVSIMIEVRVEWTIVSAYNFLILPFNPILILIQPIELPTLLNNTYTIEVSCRAGELRFNKPARI